MPRAERRRRGAPGPAATGPRSGAAVAVGLVEPGRSSRAGARTVPPVAATVAAAARAIGAGAPDAGGGATAAGGTGAGGGGATIRGGGGGGAGRAGAIVTRGGANGPAGSRDGRGGGAGRSSGRNGTILGSGLLGAAGGGATVAAGLTTAGSEGGATTRGSRTISGSGIGMIGTSGATSGTDAAGLGLTIVAAGLTSASASSSVLGFLPRDAGLATPSSFGFGTRLGFGASGRSRPLPSLTRNALARALSRGLMARTPLCPISSAATIRSLLVTPSSLASSITFIFAAATSPSPPSRFHCCVDRLARGTLDRPTRAFDHRAPSTGTRVCDHKLRADLARRAERVREPPTAERAFHALGIGTDVGPASDRASVRIGHDTAV